MQSFCFADIGISANDFFKRKPDVDNMAIRLLPSPSPENKSSVKHISPIKLIINYILPIVCAVAVAFYIADVCSYQITVEALIDGVSIGYVESSEPLTSAANKIEAEISDSLGEQYKLDCNITYKVAHAKSPVYLTEAECASILQEIADRDFCEAYMLYVDDIEVAANESYSQLSTLIYNIKSDLLASGGEEFSRVEISNRLSIEKKICKRSYLKTIEEINELINPVTKSHDSEINVAAYSETNNEPEVMRISAFKAFAPSQISESELIDPDIDYGITRIADGTSSNTHDVTLMYELIRNETVNETVYYKTQYIDDFENFIGTEKLIQEGSNGYRTVTYEVRCNSDGEILGKTELEESIITPVVDRIVIVGAKEIPEAVPTGTYIWPCEVTKGISSGYGGRDLYGSYDFHLGIDIPGTDRTAINAADGGEIIWAGFTPSYGYSVRIQHDDNYVTLYAHMEELLVSVGDMVYQGQQIGYMGHTGAAYGTHLHFEVRIGSLTTDPMKYLPALD
ncbi:MAG: peptidoglycan DD-metalloendopeptidase family protein [Clostridiales bacterium]|nr:peptidoglycan DD-metalloendopeptidase family protein [Clostridiales bacterium]